MHRYFHARQFSDLHFSLIITTTGSRSSQQEPDIESRPLYAGHHLRSIRNTPVSLSRRWDTPSILMSHMDFDTSSWVRFHSPLYISPDCILVQPFDPTLTTDTLNNCSLGWFEASFRQQTSVGLPPSSLQLYYISRQILSSLLCAPAAHSLSSTGNDRR